MLIAGNLVSVNIKGIQCCHKSVIFIKFPPEKIFSDDFKKDSNNTLYSSLK